MTVPLWRATEISLRTVNVSLPLNDLCLIVKSHVTHFADDCLLYRAIHNVLTRNLFSRFIDSNTSHGVLSWIFVYLHTLKKNPFQKYRKSYL